MFVVFAGKKPSKQVGEMPKIPRFREIWKKFNLEVMTTNFLINLAKCTNFEVSSLGLELQVPNLGIFDEVSVSVSKF